MAEQPLIALGFVNPLALSVRGGIMTSMSLLSSTLEEGLCLPFQSPLQEQAFAEACSLELPAGDAVVCLRTDILLPFPGTMEELCFLKTLGSLMMVVVVVVVVFMVMVMILPLPPGS